MKKDPANIKPPKRRRSWLIKPIQKPHSTPKGKRGYDRQQSKAEVKRTVLAEAGKEKPEGK